MQTLREYDLLVDSAPEFLCKICESNDDDERDVYDYDESHDPAKKAQFNKSMYMENYAVKFSIPTSYVMNARVLSEKPD